MFKKLFSRFGAPTEKDPSSAPPSTSASKEPSMPSSSHTGRTKLPRAPGLAETGGNRGVPFRMKDKSIAERVSGLGW